MKSLSSLEISIQTAQQTLIRRFVFLAIALMLTASVGLVLYVGRNARAVASALSSSYRNQLLIGQLREPIQGFSANVPAVFSSITYYDGQGQILFELPQPGATAAAGFFALPFEHRLFMSEDETVIGGRIEYRISVLPVLLVCGLFNLLALLVGLILLRRSLGISRQQVHDAYLIERREEFGQIARQVAHDIRSPLSAIQIAAHSVTNTNAKAARMMVTASERIQKMAEDLLAYSRNPEHGFTIVGAGSQPLPGQAVAFAAIQKAVAAVLEEKQIEWDVRIQTNSFDVSDDSAICQLDEFLRIVSNLLNNAVEATRLVEREANVQVLVKVDAKHLVIEIADNGCGIEQAQIPEILKGKSFGKIDGNGLGLSSAQRCLKVWGGGLQIRSQLDQGTQVSVFLIRA